LFSGIKLHATRLRNLNTRGQHATVNVIVQLFDKLRSRASPSQRVNE